MDIGKSITFITDDQEWLSKLALGAVIASVPILNFAWVGYLTDVMRNVSEHNELPLPDWSNLGDQFVKGLKLVLAALVYSLPGLLLLFIPVAAIFGGILLQGENMQDAFNAAFGTALAGGTIVIACCLTLYFILLALVFPAIQLHFSQEGTFGSCFRFREILNRIFSNSGNYFLALLIAFAAAIVIGIVASFAGLLVVLIPCIGWIIILVINAAANVWGGLIYAHLFGQVGSKDPLEMVVSE